MTSSRKNAVQIRVDRISYYGDKERSTNHGEAICFIRSAATTRTAMWARIGSLIQQRTRHNSSNNRRCKTEREVGSDRHCGPRGYSLAHTRLAGAFLSWTERTRDDPPSEQLAALIQAHLGRFLFNAIRAKHFLPSLQTWTFLSVDAFIVRFNDMHCRQSQHFSDRAARVR